MNSSNGNELTLMEIANNKELQNINDLNEIVDNYLKPNIEKIDNPEINKEFNDLIKDKEKIAEEIKNGKIKLNEEVQNMMDSEIINLKGFRKVMLNDLNVSLKAAVLAENKKAIKNIESAIKQTVSSNNLDLLDSPIFFGRNGSIPSLSRFKEECTKARNILKLTKKFKFKDINMLDHTLKISLTEDYKKYSRLFLFAFFKFINQKSLNDNVIFISLLINNIYNINNEDFSDFKSNVIALIDKYK